MIRLMIRITIATTRNCNDKIADSKNHDHGVYITRTRTTTTTKTTTITTKQYLY